MRCFLVTVLCFRARKQGVSPLSGYFIAHKAHLSCRIKPVGRKSETPSDECKCTKSSQRSQVVMVVGQDRFHDWQPSMRRKAFHFSDLRAKATQGVSLFRPTSYACWRGRRDAVLQACRATRQAGNGSWRCRLHGKLGFPSLSANLPVAHATLAARSVACCVQYDTCVSRNQFAV